MPTKRTSELASSDPEDESQEEQLEPYRYQEVTGAHSIRLLALSSTGKKAADIECELFETNFDNKKTQYEALSWSWGGDSWDQGIRIHHKGSVYLFEVPKTLVEALKALRLRKERRVLWVDAICIDQSNPDEKNRQVPMMAQIYGQAKSVCVWIGSGDKESKIALDFIKNEVLRLQDFDDLCEDQYASHKWRAMLDVMKRTWFSRRWVVQEIALANEATIYCGKETIAWKDFSDAVQLFVEVETATHRLSEVMKKDPKFYHVPGWFEYVSALGASLLVDATGTLFRKTKDQGRQALLSLEYLVSSMTVFEATVPHDTIYSLLAVAKDTAPTPVIRTQSHASQTTARNKLEDWAVRHMRAKPYKVDYQQPLIDVCKDFIVFCIRQSDPTRALDIICRPWAPTLRKRKPSKKKQGGHKEPKHIQVNEEFEAMPTWIPTLSGAAHSMYKHANGEWRMGRINADPLVGLPEYTQRNYSAAGTTPVNMLALRFKKYDQYYSMFVSGFVCDKVAVVEKHSQSGNIPEEWIAQGGWDEFDDDPPDDLWRTLVADRGRMGRNPPTYYSRACKESISKGLESGSLNTSELIHDGRCSVVAEFFRRVQAVIWNRSLIRTSDDALGIVGKNVEPGDLICVLYGCSVPVVLRRHEKPSHALPKEEKEYEKDRLEAVTRLQRIYRHSRQRRVKLDALRLVREKAEFKQRMTNGHRETSLTDTSPRRKLPNHHRAHSAATPPLPTTVTQPLLRSETDPQSTSVGNLEPESSGSGKRAPPPPPPPKPANLSNPVPFEEKTDKEKLKAEQRRYWYEFVGECYVHGMMDGEAIKKQNVDQIPAQTFELR